jgi:NADPH:quinone reductase-like Zn-dependent oxidoreductase
MIKKNKILGAVVLVLIASTVFVVYKGVVYSHNDACPPPSAGPASAQRMKAVVHRCYGPPVVLALEEVERVMPRSDEVLVKVHAASVNPLDLHLMRGSPYVMRKWTGFGAPREPRFGTDFAGTVEAVGPDVKTFRPGDQVFGAGNGALAEYVLVRQSDKIAPKPTNLSFAQAAAVTVAGTTALLAVRDWGRIKAGQKVLINGASGGVGTFAVQIAKAYGAEVTGVCSTRNADMVRSIGADHVIDYRNEDFTAGPQRYDVIIDMIGNHSVLELARAMQRDAILVMVGDAEVNDWLWPTMEQIKLKGMRAFVSQDLTTGSGDSTQEDLNFLRDLMQAGKLTPVIDRMYRLDAVPAAIEYLETRRARGKVVIVVDGELETSG